MSLKDNEQSKSHEDGSFGTDDQAAATDCRQLQQTLMELVQDGALDLRSNTFRPTGGSWGNSCDQRLKRDITPLSEVLGKLLQLRGIRFFYKEPEKTGGLSGPQIGFIAQEVEKVFPDWVRDGPDGYKGLTIRGFEALVIEALRELKTEIDTCGKELQNKELPVAQALMLEVLQKQKLEIEDLKMRVQKLERQRPVPKKK